MQFFDVEKQQQNSNRLLKNREVNKTKQKKLSREKTKWYTNQGAKSNSIDTK